MLVCFVKDNVFKATYYDQIIKDIGDALKLELNRRFLKTGAIKQLVQILKRLSNIYNTYMNNKNLRSPMVPMSTEVYFLY